MGSNLKSKFWNFQSCNRFEITNFQFESLKSNSHPKLASYLKSRITWIRERLCDWPSAKCDLCNDLMSHHKHSSTLLERCKTKWTLRPRTWSTEAGQAMLSYVKSIDCRSSAWKVIMIVAPWYRRHHFAVWDHLELDIESTWLAGTQQINLQVVITIL